MKDNIYDNFYSNLPDIDDQARRARDKKLEALKMKKEEYDIWWEQGHLPTAGPRAYAKNYPNRDINDGQKEYNRWWDDQHDKQYRDQQLGSTWEYHTTSVSVNEDKKEIESLKKEIERLRTVQLNKIRNLEKENIKLKRQLDFIEKNPEEYHRRKSIDPYDEENWDN